VTKGSFYYHHADKDELIVACFERTLEILREGQTRPYPGDGWARLCAAAASLALYQSSGHARAHAAHLRLRRPAPELRQPIRADLRRATFRFAAMISDGIADGSIRAVDPMVAAHTLMATVTPPPISSLAQLPQLRPGGAPLPAP